MAIDYQLHNLTQKKIEGLVNVEVELKRKEKNLKYKIDRLQDAVVRLEEDKKLWNKKRGNINVELETKERKAKTIDKESERLLKSLVEEKKQLVGEKESLQKAVKKSEADKKRLKVSLTKFIKKVDELRAREEMIITKEEHVSELLSKADMEFKKKDKLYQEAKEKASEADKLLKKAKQKNKEANGLKIKLGLREKGLGEKERDIARQMRDLKYGRIALEQASKELMLKRKLLSKAYTQADVEDLDKKVAQMLASEQK